MSQEWTVDSPTLESLSTLGILDAMPDGVYLTDTSRKIVFWNQAAERITGWKREDVLGRPCSDNILVHIDKDGNKLCGNTSCPLHRAIVTGENSETPVLVFAQSKSGERIPMEVSVAPLRNNQGETIGGVEVFRDMTETMMDLNRARLIQKTALNSAPIDDPRLKVATLCKPHDMVGGDFLHVEKLDADRYGIFVADVTGHGVSAALYTMQLRSLWDEYRRKLDTPDEFMSAINTRLNALANPNDYFATAVHFVVDASTGIVDYTCAGHPTPLHVRGGGTIERLREKDPCLGLFPDTVFHRGQTRIATGESLVVYTDGAIEIDNSLGQELGVEGLTLLMSRYDFSDSNNALKGLEEELLNYSHHVRLPDDLTLLCVHRTNVDYEN